MTSLSRIPKLAQPSFDGALQWFAELQCGAILFHPEDDPAHIVRIADGARLFSDTEVAELRFVLDELERELGHEQVIEAAYPIFMNACGMRLDA